MRIVATGDSIVTRRISTEGDADFTELLTILRDADVAYTNLEMVFPGQGRSPGATYHGTHLGVDPELLGELTWMGFDVYGMANNHASDYGTDGLAASIDELRKRRMRFAGVGRTLREARRPVYVETELGRVALISAGSSNARLSVAADPGIDDVGRPGMAPVRLQKTHHIKHDQFDALRGILADAGVNVTPSGTTAKGVFLPYPDMNVWDGPPAGGFAVEGVHFAPDETSHIDTRTLDRDVDALISVVDEAARQADLVFVALHCHEGEAGRWNNETPAEFLQPLAHSLIDSGANAIFGTGPHMLRGMELYQGRPICYSLGNFIFTLETMASFPLEVYEQLGMPPTSTTADLYDRITGYKDEHRFWETVLARLTFDNGQLRDSELIPVTLGNDLPRSRRGRPVLAQADDGQRILERLAELSKPFKTGIQITTQNGRPVGSLTTL
jgi:poly-gamma-glutamate synthesis protein (capsule biosynthesis protein)